MAEDDAAIRKLLAAALRRRRLDVETAADGEETCRKLANASWCVLLLDLMMPKVSGWEVIQWLEAHPEQRPRSVIVMSAADREALRELDPAVVNAIVFKPFDVLQLGAYVRAAAQHDGHERRHHRVIGSV